MVGPEWASWAVFPVGVVDAFLMRTANDAIKGRDRLCPVLLDETNNCFSDFRIGSHIARFGEPSFEYRSLFAFCIDDADSDFRRTSGP